MSPEALAVGALGAAAILVVAAAALVLGVLSRLDHAREDARAQERRAGSAELALERVARERAEQRAGDAEHQRDEFARATRDYLAALGPMGEPGRGPSGRDRLWLLLDATQHAAGAVAAGPTPPGDDGSGQSLG